MYVYIVIGLLALLLFAVCFSLPSRDCEPFFPDIERRCHEVRRSYPYV